ncbi:MAG TPA: tetratricopeptide repeat protein [Elusimicrobiota bacterium]|nr:tetratricopeptide repeat protein [Elusimicrobiota bacterium]
MSRSLLVAALSVLVAAAPAFAQNPDVMEKEGQRPAEQAAKSSKTSEAASESAKLNAGGGADVTFEQVAADPDNVDLNYRYAQTQVRHGNLKGASATLERILLVNPNLVQIRLFYGVVLYRLDNLMEADREVSAVLASNPPDSIRTEASRYLAEIHKRQKRTQLSGRLGVGWEYDDNRNAGPSTGINQLFGNPVQLDPSSMRRSDTSVLFLGNVEAHHDLGLPAGHSVFATFNWYRAEQTTQKTLNLSAYSPALGGVYKTPFFDVTPQLVYDYISLAQTKYMKDHGFDLRADKTLSARAAVYADVRDVREVYSPTAVVPTASDRTGIRVDSTIGGDYALCPTNRLGLDVLYGVKHAQNIAFTYFRRGFGASDTWLLGKGTFLLTTLRLNVDNYDHADPLVSPGLRRDTIIQTDVTAGAPLSLLHPKLQDLVFTLTYENYDAMSTISNYSYTNNKISGLLTYKWSAGF